MNRVREVKIPVHYFDNEKWLLLNVLGNSGNLRADVISNPTTTKDAEKLGQELALSTTQKKMADSIEINSKFILSIFIFR